MRRCLLFLLLSIPVMGYCQQKEFDLYAGLLYTSSDMQELKKTADSLNLRYLECVANPQYQSWPQTEALCYRLVVQVKQLSLLEAQLKNAASLNDLVQNIPGVVVKDTAYYVLAYTTSLRLRNRQPSITLLYGDGSGFANDKLHDIPGNGQWICVTGTYDTTDVQVDVKLFLLDRPFASVQLPKECAKMIQYVDCMVDPDTAVMLAERDGDEYDNQPLKKLMEYARQRKHPELDSAKYWLLDLEAERFIAAEYPKNRRVHQLMDDAITDALKNGNGGETLERLAGCIFSKDTVLLLMRSRTVTGFCSMDQAPRRHARNIAVMASRLHKWPVFIRAHLDIMNDYFSRMADGNYAAAGRSTYLRELELLDIPAQQLLLGTVFRVTNVPDKHYYGNLGRIGRAFTESAYTAAFEKQVKAFMTDRNIDPFNKCLFTMLYENYIDWQTDAAVKKVKLAALKAEYGAYPAYIQAAIKKLHD